MSADESPSVKCPHCGGDLHMEAVATLAPESQVSLSLYAASGELMSAETIGGAITHFAKMLKAVGKEIGVPTEVLFSGFSSGAPEETRCNFIITRFDKPAKRKARQKAASAASEDTS